MPAYLSLCMDGGFRVVAKVSFVFMDVLAVYNYVLMLVSVVE